MRNLLGRSLIVANVFVAGFYFGRGGLSWLTTLLILSVVAAVAKGMLCLERMPIARPRIERPLPDVYVSLVLSEEDECQLREEWHRQEGGER